MYRAKIHQQNLEAISKSRGKISTRLIARVLSMWIDANSEEEREMVRWAREMVTSTITGSSPPEKPGKNNPEDFVWTL